jgi:catechol 1,2-dioxygenase
MSQLVETLNHEQPDQPVGFALVGPFFRSNAPLRERGASIASDDTAGARVRITGRAYDVEKQTPIRGAILDICQPDYNLRGRFVTDAEGTFEIVALMPTSYPVPIDGPVGELLRAAQRPP